VAALAARSSGITRQPHANRRTCSQLSDSRTASSITLSNAGILEVTAAGGTGQATTKEDAKGRTICLPEAFERDTRASSIVDVVALQELPVGSTGRIIAAGAVDKDIGDAPRRFDSGATRFYRLLFQDIARQPHSLATAGTDDRRFLLRSRCVQIQQSDFRPYPGEVLGHATAQFARRPGDNRNLTRKPELIEYRLTVQNPVNRCGRHLIRRGIRGVGCHYPRSLRNGMLLCQHIE